MLFEISLGALTPGTNGHGKVLIRIARGREFVEVRAGFVESDHEETDAIRSAPVLLSVDLRLLITLLELGVRVDSIRFVLSAMEATRRLAGIGRL